MNLGTILKSILNLQKKIDLTTLPSQGLFYKDDFEIFIKKADVGDIIEYEYDYQKDQDTDEVKVYSFFGDENFDRERLLQAIKILGENRYPHISVSPDSVDPFPSSIDLSMHDFLKKSIVDPGSHIPDHCGGYIK